MTPHLSASSTDLDRLLVRDRLSLPRLDLVPHVRGLRRADHEVVRIVVESVAVDMVHHFAGQESATRGFRCHDAMNATLSDLEVVFGMGCLERHPTIARAEQAASFLRLGRGDVERRVAVLARRVSARPPERRVAELGAPCALGRLPANGACVHSPIVADCQAKASAWFSPGCLRPEDAVAQRGLFALMGMT